MQTDRYAHVSDDAVSQLKLFDVLSDFHDSSDRFMAWYQLPVHRSSSYEVSCSR